VFVLTFKSDRVIRLLGSAGVLAFAFIFSGARLDISDKFSIQKTSL
jgi:hypothetical protein